ncbi:MAG: helix-turn-helix domain-containing protein [Promethearchaeota archaeon]
MLIHKAFKFRIYPNKAQRTILNKTFGYCGSSIIQCWANGRKSMSNTKRIRRLFTITRIRPKRTTNGNSSF